MKEIKYIKALFSGLALATALCPQAKAEIREETDCGGTCKWYYNTETGDIDIKGTGIISVGARQRVVAGGNIHNVTIGEGITNEESYMWNGISGSGVLKYPSTYIGGEGTASNFGTYGTVFGAIDVSALNHNRTMLVASQGDVTLIISDKQPTNFSVHHAYSQPTSVNIVCKGDIDICQNKARKHWQTSSNVPVNYSYYKGLDEDGNYIEYSDDGLAIWSDSTKPNCLEHMILMGIRQECINMMAPVI